MIGNIPSFDFETLKTESVKRLKVVVLRGYTIAVHQSTSQDHPSGPSLPIQKCHQKKAYRALWVRVDGGSWEGY